MWRLDIVSLIFFVKAVVSHFMVSPSPTFEDDVPLARLLNRHESSDGEVWSDSEISGDDQPGSNVDIDSQPTSRDSTTSSSSDSDDDLGERNHDFEMRNDIDFDHENVGITRECRNRSVLELFQLFLRSML